MMLRSAKEIRDAERNQVALEAVAAVLSAAVAFYLRNLTVDAVFVVRMFFAYSIIFLALAIVHQVLHERAGR